MNSNLASNMQVIAAARMGISAEDIASDMGYDLAAVKIALAELGEKWSGEGELVVSGEKREVKLFSEDEVEVARNTLIELVTTSELDTVKFKAAEFIINESKGRNDVAKLNGALADFNISLVTETMRRCREAMNRTREKAMGKATVVELEKAA